MTKQDFYSWCERTGYMNITDWEYQIIDEVHYYFIINPKTDKFALIKFVPSRLGLGDANQFEVLAQNWTDYNGWAEKFHEETNYVWKRSKK